MAPQVPVVVVVDDDDAPASPPTRRRRSRATPPPAAANSPDSLDAFSTSPPLPKRRAPATPIVLDDDTPPPPKRRASEGPPEPPGSVVPETPQSFVPCSLGPGPGPRAAVAETTLDSVLPCSFRFDFDADVSEIRGSAVPCGIDPDIAIAETPGFTTTRSVGPATAPGFPPAASPQKLSGASCPISLDSDDELDDIGYREPLTKLPSNTAKSEPMIRPGTSSCLQNNGGKINFGQHPHAGLPCEDSTLKEEEKHDKEENPRLIEERKKKQEEKRLKKEEKVKSIEEKKRQREENKLLKEANKVQKAEQKKYAKEKEDWGSGKHALKSIVAEIDSTIIETGSVAGILLTRFAEKDLKYRVKANSIRGSILWKMEVPQIGQDPASVSEVPYILFVIQAEKFCDLISSGSFFDHVLDVRSRYPTFTICYVTNKLMSYITKCERHQYKNPSSSNSWQRPPVEEVLCKLATHYVRVHSRQCADEAEVADHVVGLTSSLANCKFRKPLTWLSVHANGAMIPKNFIDKDLAKKDTWMKALIAIPKVQPRFALAIWKTYPTMRSLLNVYMDPSKTDHEKELLLKDLKCEDRLGDESRRVGPKCSRRVYKILMAQNGATDADDAE